MKPPIAPPFGDEKFLLCKRVEWNAERECFLLRYAPPMWGVLRCESYGIVRHQFSFLLFTLLLPLTLLLVLCLNIRQQFAKPGELSIFEWGFEDDHHGLLIKTEWQHITGILVRNDDVVIQRITPHTSDYYMCRECLINESESHRLQRLSESLWLENGANWGEIQRQFRA